MIYQVKPSYINYVNPFYDINLIFFIETDKTLDELRYILMEEARKYISKSDPDWNINSLPKWESWDRTFDPFKSNFLFPLRSCYEGNIGFITPIHKINKLKI